MCSTLFLLAASLAPSDLPSVRLDRISPLGAAAGSSVEIEILGDNIEDAKLLFDHPGFKGEHLKDRRFRITLAADVPVGTYDIRIDGKYGVSNPRLFAVSAGLQEIAQKKPNEDRAGAQVVPLNSVINGQSSNNKEDFYRFTLEKGQRVVVECQATCLDSEFKGSMVLSGANGAQLGSNSGYNGADPLVDVVAAESGDYYVSIHDRSFRGGLSYRLLVTDRPRVENVFPRAVQVGRPTQMTIFGRNLGSKAKPSSWRINELPLDEMMETITPPNDLFESGGYRFVEHPTAYSVLPTAATFPLIGYQFRPQCDDWTANATSLLLTDTPVTLEQEPNDDPKNPQKLTLPAVVCGRFDRERDADWYEFETAEQGNYAFDVYCERIGGRADPYLVLMDDKGQRMKELDDMGPRHNAFDAHLRDPADFVPLDGKRKYRVLVQDRYRRGGARYQYVLTIHKAAPDFSVAAIHRQNPGPGGLTIHQGGADYLDIIVWRKEGFTGPITLTAENLPKGLHAMPTVIAEERATFVLWADADAPEWTGPIRLFATSRRGDTVLRREIRPYARVWKDGGENTSRPTREQVVAIRSTAPFATHFPMDRIEVEAGKKIELPMQLDRLQGDFKSAVTLSPLMFPGRIQMGTVLIPEGKNDVMLGIQTQPDLPPGEYTLTVQAQAQVPFSKDPKVNPKPNTIVTLPSRPITLVVSKAKGG